MNIAEISKQNGLLTVALNGRIDSGNAAQVEAEINAGIQGAKGDMIIDAQSLNYISSAGLRVILRLRKAHPELKVINASPDVYDIFEITGFTEMMTVEKAYRSLSVEGCEVIGQGANGRVYRYDPETIVKVYFNSDALDDIKRERELARKAFVLGIPTAIPYDVVRVGDSYGSVYELLNAKSFAKLMVEEPEKLDEYIGMFVDLMKKIHSTIVGKDDMPNMKETALGWADDLKTVLADAEYVRLKALLEAVPDSCHMVHGDYHTKNVMMQNGEVLLIDMDTLSRGNPVFEMASVYNAYVGFGVIHKEAIENFMDMDIKTAGYVWRKTLELYLGTDDPEKISEAENKAKLLGNVRLLRRTLRRNAQSDDGKKLIEYCKHTISEVLPKVQKLDFTER